MTAAEKRIKREYPTAQENSDDAGHDDLAPEAVQSIGHASISSSPKKRAFTTVDGQGMWRSWTRVFAKPQSACLDLLDNCFDAVLSAKKGQQNPGGDDDDENDIPDNSQSSTAATTRYPSTNRKGRVELIASGESTVMIQNTSLRPIKPLQDALTVYKSSKNSSSVDNKNVEKDSIGENGVGLKQGAATLSDCSLVFTKNKTVFEIGVIAKQLQTDQGVYLPSFSFVIYEPDEELSHIISNWLAKNRAIEQALANSFCDLETPVAEQVLQLAQRLWDGMWLEEPHVFLLVLCNIKTTAPSARQSNSSNGDTTTNNNENVNSNNASNQPPAHELMLIPPAQRFLNEIQSILPRYYVNLPLNNLDVLVNGHPLLFSYWQQRLVELTHFTVPISKHTHFETDPTWDQPEGKYQLDVFCGFDCVRLRDHVSKKARTTSACQLHVHSCHAGRLIQTEQDARFILRLGASGVDFTQGLTVIVVDAGGQLPLTPTKDGIAWSEELTGDIHSANLYAWTSAVAFFYWKHWRDGFGKKKAKEAMKNTIAAIANHLEGLKSPTENLVCASFNQFHGLKWKRNQTATSMTIRPGGPHGGMAKGNDTLIPMVRRTTTQKTSKSGQSGSGTPAEGSTEPPEVEPSQVVSVGQNILQFLREQDDGKVFEVPVVQLCPHLADAYLEVIAKPMDFMTIERRLYSYSSIEEFLADVKLIFQNCVQFNGEDSEYSLIARAMMERLDEDLEDLMKGKRVRKKIRPVRYKEKEPEGEGKEPSPGRRPSTTTNKKKPPSLHSQLRDTKKELKESKMQLDVAMSTIAKLQQQLADRDRKLQHVEGSKKRKRVATDSRDEQEDDSSVEHVFHC